MQDYITAQTGFGPGILGGPAGPVLKIIVLGIKYYIMRLSGQMKFLFKEINNCTG